MNVCLCMCVHVCDREREHVCMCACAYVHMQARFCECWCVCVEHLCVCMHVYFCVHVCVPTKINPALRNIVNVNIVICTMFVDDHHGQTIRMDDLRCSDIQLRVAEARLQKVNPDTFQYLPLRLVDHHCQRWMN